jgi:hypothetical protein
MAWRIFSLYQPEEESWQLWRQSAALEAKIRW